MDMNSENNFVRLCGVMAGRPVYSHTGRGEEFYTFPLEVLRLSGNTDTVNIVVRRDMLSQTQLGEDAHICVTGQLRTYNNRRGTGAKLVITVLAFSIELCSDDDSNYVELTGTVCKAPNLRRTPMGRDICDIMLAVNRQYGRSDYLPCICWGIRARDAAMWPVGTRIHLYGRIQSRRYIKVIDGQAVERTAFEVSASEIEELIPSGAGI